MRLRGGQPFQPIHPSQAFDVAAQRGEFYTSHRARFDQAEPQPADAPQLGFLDAGRRGSLRRFGLPPQPAKLLEQLHMTHDIRIGGALNAADAFHNRPIIILFQA